LRANWRPAPSPWRASTTLRPSRAARSTPPSPAALPQPTCTAARCPSSWTPASPRSAAPARSGSWSSERSDLCDELDLEELLRERQPGDADECARHLWVLAPIGL